MTPIYEIEVEIILQCWCIQYFVGHFGYFTDVFAVMLADSFWECKVLMIDQWTKHIQSSIPILITWINLVKIVDMFVVGERVLIGEFK